MCEVSSRLSVEVEHLLVAELRGHSPKFAAAACRMCALFLRAPDGKGGDGANYESPLATQRAPSPPLLCLTALCKCYEGTTGVNLCPPLRRAGKGRVGDELRPLFCE